MTIDVWMQHPTQRFLHGDMFASLRRWTGGSIPETDIPIEATVSSMDAGGVTLGLLSAWRGPNGQDLISKTLLRNGSGCTPTVLPVWRRSTWIARWRPSGS